MCSHCGSTFSVAHGGRSDIADHVKSAKHKSAVSEAASSNITSYFKSTDPQNKELMMAAKEATFAYHTASHDFSFKSADCSSKLISQLFLSEI